ncbi:MAG: dehydrogenase [Nitratiruptor sp.]|nr:dehydrogenase [Nitratiruptor sp.]NPA83541.1 dehydrogenase [Campylobacterota bacterium]
MDHKARAFVYAFLSRLFEKPLGAREIEDLLHREELLETIGPKAYRYFQEVPPERLEEELNIDFSSLFIVNSQPVETLVLDSTREILVGLQNPVMFFYFEHGYEIDMNRTHLLAPDHLAIEFGFMQNLAYRQEDLVACRFLREHLLQWVPPYLLAMGSVAQTPFYQDVCDFTIDFLFNEYSHLGGVCDGS